MKQLYILLLFCISFASCRKDDDPGPRTVDPAPVPAPGAFSEGIVVVNEGNYTWGNASLSFINRQSNAVHNDVFQSVNGRPLGDVAQSIVYYNDRAFIVVNNSQKVEIVEKNTLKSAGTITGLTSPRYMAFISSQKAYVTDLYSNCVWVVDPSQKTITSSIQLTGQSEELLVHNGKAYIANTTASRIIVIDTSTDQITDTIHVGAQPSGIVKDANNKLWVLCAGDGSPASAGLYRIDPASRSVERSFVFSSMSAPRLTLNPARDSIYLLNHDVFKMGVNPSSLPSQPLISGSNNLFYGIGVDPSSGTIYLSDAVDYVQQGWVFRYKPNGAKVDSFRVGIIPGAFGFN